MYCCQAHWYGSARLLQRVEWCMLPIPRPMLKRTVRALHHVAHPADHEMECSRIIDPGQRRNLAAKSCNNAAWRNRAQH